MTDTAQKKLDLNLLKELVAGKAVAIRGRARLQPAGGPGDKVFPPTHSVDEKKARAGARYAFETRKIDKAEVSCVLLDSVQSQANRMEEALQALWVDKRIKLPVITVDFTETAPDVGRLTSLSVPHRIADALLRDSMTDKNEFFRTSPIGTSFTDATARNAGPLFKVCPTGLLFGLWDSTGPKGGLGSKFPRALVSEIVGIDATPGAKTASRIDPTGIVTKAAEVYEAKDPAERWTIDPKVANQKDGKPVKIKDGKVSQVNHSNIPPTIDELGGGVTIDHAAHTVVLSLATLRKLHFQEEGDKGAARTVLAALGVLSVLAAESRGHDFRSRCLLVPEPGKALALEAVLGDGTTLSLAVDLEGALALYNAAVADLPKGLSFEKEPGVPLAELKPSKKLAHLVSESRKIAGAGADIEEP